MQWQMEFFYLFRLVYTAWSNWSACSTTCGPGNVTSNRTCTQNGDLIDTVQCVQLGLGEAVRIEPCNDTSPCAGTVCLYFLLNRMCPPPRVGLPVFNPTIFRAIFQVWKHLCKSMACPTHLHVCYPFRISFCHYHIIFFCYDSLVFISFLKVCAWVGGRGVCFWVRVCRSLSFWLYVLYVLMSILHELPRVFCF